MKIKKRNGNLEQLSFDKIIYRLKKLCNDKTLGVLKKIDPDVVAQRVVSSIYDGVPSTELDEEAARIAVSMTENMEYQKLASRIVISNMHKSTIECFSEVMENLYNNTDKSGNPMPIIADDVIEIVRANKDALNFEIDYNRDYMFDYFGFKTLERSYLMKIWDQNSNEMRVVERPQHLYMRVAVGIHKDDIPSVIKTYHLISQHFYTHASPTLFNSSSRLSAFTSCYLLGTNDSIDGIFKTVSDCAKISKLGGGIGVHISNIRAKGSLIRGTNGLSDGIIPMIKVYNASAVYVNQCITPDTIVYAKDGFKRMDEITTSDYLITHDGTFKQVNEVIVNKKNELIYEINNCGSIDPLKCTKEHDIYVIRANMYKYPSMVKQSLQIGSIKPEFVPASEVKKDYYMGYPIPTYECDIPQFSNEQCRLYGIMLGDGSIIKNDTTARYQITLNNKSKLSTKAFVVDYLVRNNIHYWINNDCEICFTYNSKTIEKIGITEEMLYDKKKNKFMDTRFLHLPKEKAAMLMKGMMESDGCQTATGLWFTSTDKNLIYSMKYLCLRFGILTSCQTIDKVGQIMSYNKKGRPIISRKVAYQLRIPKLQILKDYKIKTDFTCQLKVNYFFEWNNILFTRIKRIEHINYSGDVYDFNMIDNHNYLTDMGLVHNSGRRKGSFALYCEPWHADILEFLELKKNQGHDDVRARDLFYAIWTPDLFMKQVESDGDWYLMCPDECPGLPEKYGEEFEELYWKYVEEKKYRKVVKAQEVWKKILEAQIETGVPYICYKDSINKKCNQKSLGTIKSSNLCSEISLYSDDKEYACCFTGDTRVLTATGYQRIDQCDNLEVFSFFNNDTELKEQASFKRAKLIDNGEKDVFKLICTGTKPIKATSDHLFLTITGRNNNKKVNKYKWKQLSELQPKDKILLPCTNVLPLYDITPTEDIAYMSIGWMLGDGWQSGGKNRVTYGVCFGPDEEYARDKVAKCFSDMVNLCDDHKNGRHKSTSSCYKDKNGVYNWSSSKQSFIKYIKETYGLHEKTAHFKEIPDKIKESTPNQISSFLSGLFSADGTVYIGNRKRFNVGLTSASETLLYDTQELLRCFGIESRCYYYYVKTKDNYQGCLIIDNIKSIERFAQYIKFTLCQKKQDKLTYGLKTVQKRETNRQYAVVKSVEYHGVEKVYDLNIPETHNFLAEGQVVHNCNLSSIALPKFVEYENGKPYFNFEKLCEIAEYIITPMNKVIDNNYYPTPETAKSNFAHRPLGIGAQGLADVFFKMKLPFESKEAKQLNKEIFETIYYGCMKGSIELAKKDGAYSSFKGSPFSEGKFQFDLAQEYDGIKLEEYLSGRWDWETLRKELVEYGARNSMLVALMPTASTAQIMGNIESFEPIDSCIFKRRVLSGEFMVVNKHLVEDLNKLKLWNKEMKDTIIANNGSIQSIAEIPDELKEVYKTVWEISMKSVIEQCRDRGVFVDQMQSMNLFMANPTYKKLSSMHFYGWKNNLKTGCYYLRSKAIASAGKFSVDANLEKQIRKKKQKGEELKREEEVLLCSLDNPESCEMCSS
jgi:ribonucleoside-diphosphate reductase alpha chain